MAKEQTRVSDLVFAYIVGTTIENINKNPKRWISKAKDIGITATRVKVLKGVFEYELEYEVEEVTEDDLYETLTERLKNYMVSNFGTSSNIKYDVIGYLLRIYAHEQYVDTNSIPMTQKEIADFINKITTRQSLNNYNQILKAFNVIEYGQYERQFEYYVTARYPKGYDIEYYKSTH